MKNIISVLLLLVISGCTSVTIPNYIADKHPNQKVFYVPYEQVHTAVLRVLVDLGWTIEREADPALYERGRQLQDEDRKQTVIFTDIHQLSFLAGSRYVRLNVFLRVTSDKATEVEIRSLEVTSVMLKTMYNYKNDRVVNRIFKHIEEELNP